jgi:methionine synthase I (cobalamin-dependent)
MSRFLKALHSGRVLLMDGAMGTELQKRGLKDGENAAAWNLLHPDEVAAVHRAYREAGAKVLLTNTFMLYCSTFSDTIFASGRPSYSQGEVWEAAYNLLGPKVPRIYRIVSHSPVWGSPGPIEFEDLDKPVPLRIPFHAPFMKRFYKPAHAVLLETCSTPRFEQAIPCIRKAYKGPILLSLTYLRNERGELATRSGHTPEWFAERAAPCGVAALGVNCGRDIDMDDVIAIIRRYRAVTDLPLFARPNAGTPQREGGRWVYPHTPKQMAERLPALLEAGVCMVGGCCGTTPEHIAAFREVVDRWNACRG